MSVTDPLLKDLKANLLLLLNEGDGNSKITDDSLALLPLCSILEKILRQGLRRHHPRDYPKTTEPWDWLLAVANTMEEGMVEKSFGYLRSVETVQNSVKVRQPTGKLRLLIRCCLVNKCLDVPVRVMHESSRRWTWYHPHSLLGDPILCQILLSLLSSLSLPSFTLSLPSARFLDSSWRLPPTWRGELVPCKELGVGLCFVGDHAVVVSLDPGGVAAEDDKIRVGDILDELNHTTITRELKGKLKNLTRGTKPVEIALIRPSEGVDNGVGVDPVLREVLQAAGVYLGGGEREKEENGALQAKEPECKPGCKVTYLGAVSTGAVGDVKQITPSIKKVLATPNEVCDASDARLECQELGVRLERGGVVVKHAYMEISACGETACYPKHFAYIVGDNVCSEAKNFTCHVFKSERDDEIQSILRSIGQGFHRTHFAV